MPNFDVAGHPSNIKVDFLNIARLRIGNALNVLDKNSQNLNLINLFVFIFRYLYDSLYEKYI